MYCESEVQVFPKQLKNLTKLQCVKTKKELFIEPLPYSSIHTEYISFCYVKGKSLPYLVVTSKLK